MATKVVTISIIYTLASIFIGAKEKQPVDEAIGMTEYYKNQTKVNIKLLQLRQAKSLNQDSIKGNI